ncbi:hypothetical protein ACK350_20790, partial [Aeromonas veronii]
WIMLRRSLATDMGLCKWSGIRISYLDVFIAKQIGTVLSHDVERMVEMCAQAYKAGYRVCFVGC